MTNIADLNAEDRQAALFAMPAKQLGDTLAKLMADNRLIEQPARLDALTIYCLRSLAPRKYGPYPADSHLG